MVDAGLHPADVVAHDEQNVGLVAGLGRTCVAGRGPRWRSSACLRENRAGQQRGSQPEGEHCFSQFASTFHRFSSRTDRLIIS